MMLIDERASFTQLCDIGDRDFAKFSVAVLFLSSFFSQQPTHPSDSTFGYYIIFYIHNEFHALPSLTNHFAEQMRISINCRVESRITKRWYLSRELEPR